MRSYGWGTGVDFLVAQGNKIFELREVTNFDRFDQNGNPEYINKQRKDALIKSLTRKTYWKNFGNSKKRFYPTPNIIIDPVVWKKTLILKVNCLA